jgi:hypothetical protein
MKFAGRTDNQDNISCVIFESVKCTHTRIFDLRGKLYFDL